MDFYMSIGVTNFDPQVTEDIVQEFALIYKALAQSREGCPCWFLKPKFHLMQELSLEAHIAGDPVNYWTYKDEDFVGVVAGMATSRVWGGGRNPATIPKNVFVRIWSS